MYAGLSLQQAPPISVPLRFFLTAPLFACASAIVAMVLGSDAFSHRFAVGWLVVTHLMMLGFISMIMCGAIMQMLPVIAGAIIRKPLRIAMIVHPSLSLGVIALSIGFITHEPFLFWLASGLLGVALASFTGIVFKQLLSAKAAHDTVKGMRLSVFCLALTLVLGLAMALAHAQSGLVLWRPLVTDIHLFVGVFGWCFLLIVAVAYQVIPMFQLTPEYSPRLMRLVMLGVVCGLCLWAVGTIVVNAVLFLLGLSVLALSIGSFALVSLDLLSQRRRQLTDASVWFWRIALVSMLIAIFVLGLFASLEHPASVLFAVVMFVGGGILSVIFAMVYKIVPFLIWFHLQNRQMMLLQPGKQLAKIPTMNAIMPSVLVWRQLWLHVFSMILVAGAFFWSALFFYPATIMVCCSFGLLQWNLIRAILIYWRRIAD